MTKFRNRVEAGRMLAAQLTSFRGTSTVVLGLPRGGVPVAAEVARALDLPLDVLVVRKLGLPSHPEVAMGAIGEGSIRVLDPEIMRRAHVDGAALSRTEAAERAVLDSRVARLHRTPLDLAGRTALIVDDGIATGATARAACAAARHLGASRVVVAAPVGAPDAVAELIEADDVSCLLTPSNFWAVGQFYDDFSETTDAEVDRLLTEAAAREDDEPTPNG
jgi:putative phosphoribosyl transferase